jgi:hypothetical protein
MNELAETLLNYAVPALAAALGSFAAVKASVSRLQVDVKVLFRKVDQLQEKMQDMAIEGEREAGDLKVAIAGLKAIVDNLALGRARQQSEK